MPTTFKIRKNSSTLLTLNDDSAYSHVSGTPRETGFRENALDLQTSVTSDFDIMVRGATRDILLENRTVLERALKDAELYQDDPNLGGFFELEWAYNGATNSLYSEIRGGWVEHAKEAPVLSEQGGYLERCLLHVVHRPTWEAAETSITLSTSPSNLGASNFAELPALLGNLPARCRIYFTVGSGNAATIKRALAAIRAKQSPTSFVHQLKTASMPTDWTVTAGANTAITSDSDFISGSKARYTPPDTALNEVIRWEYAPATVADSLKQFGNFLDLLRYRENTSTGNFKVYLQMGVKVGSTYVYGVTPDLTKTKFNGGTAEIGVLDLGIERTPGLGNQNQAVATLVWRLLAQAGVTGGSRTLDVDVVARFPLSEGGIGKGLAFAEFPAAVGANRVYLDFLRNRDRAYLADTSANKLVPASDWVDGGEILLIPQLAGQRVYFGAFTNTAAGFTWDKTTTLSVVMTYRPHYLSARGGTT